MENEIKLALSDLFITRIAKSLHRNSDDEIREEILALQLEGIDKDEIYRRLMSGHGVPGTHASGKTDYKPKDGGKSLARGRRSRFRR